MKRLLLLILGVIVLSSLGVAQDKPSGIRVKSIEITAATSDDLTMHGWFTPSPDAGAPLVVMLPMMGRAHDSYAPLVHGLYVAASKASIAGQKTSIPNILTVDLRGHGESVISGKDTLSFQTMPDAQFKKYPDDVKTLIDRLLADKSLRINRQGIILVGASIGANTAIMTAPLLKGVTKVAMLSPGLDYHSLKPAEAMKEFTGKVFVGACENDSYAAESSTSLTEMAPEHTVIHIYLGHDHGTNIILNNKKAMSQLADWLLE